jgi:aldose 1-epimerase
MTTSPDDAAYLAVRKAFDAPWPGPRGARVELVAGDLSATIHPADGCRLASFTVGGVELMRGWTPERRAFQYGCFPMVPWVGRMRDGRLAFQGKTHALPVNKPPHAMHGMACFAPWQIVRTGPRAAEFVLPLEDPWPWKGHVVQCFELTEEALQITLSVCSGGAEFPAAAGWHPWFRKWLGETGDGGEGSEAEKLHIAFSAAWQEEPGDDELPTGRRGAVRPGPWDDCFGFTGPMHARLDWPGRFGLDISSAASSMVVFDKKPDAACVEPLSGPPDGINTCPAIVTPATPLVVKTSWNIKRK